MKINEEDTSQGMQAALEPRKGKETGSLPKPPGTNATLPIP